jgi:hypothetical protein
MARLHDRAVGLESSSPSCERPIAAGQVVAHSDGMAHATAVRGVPVRLRRGWATKLHRLHDTAERGDDLDAIAVVVLAVFVFVFVFVGILTAIALSLYLTTG